MPNLQHLRLPRVEHELPRKKTGYGRPPGKEYKTHGRRLEHQLYRVLRSFRTRRPPQGIDPNFILRIQLDKKAIVAEQAWERCGLVLLSVDENKTLVLFSSDQDLVAFKRRLKEYQGGPRSEDQKGAPHTPIFASIDQIGEVRPRDRIGRLFRAHGVTRPDHIQPDKEYIVDAELWDLGTRQLCQKKLDEVGSYIEAKNGRVTDRYIGESLVLFRARCQGQVIRDLLEINSIAAIDLPPQPTLTVAQILDLGIQDFPAVKSPPDGAPSVAVLDSGLASAHPLLAPAVGEATAVPQSWGDASDAHGHGTMVSGLALYGDVQECIDAGSFVPRLTLYSARVLNDRCEFDDENLITSQMRDAVQYFRGTYGCRVFNISLGDARLPYRGGKVSAWASILDTLARELDVVIVVSAGNYNHDPGPDDSADSHIQDYPRYLFDDLARIIEPATGAIVLTVGALAQSADIPTEASASGVSFQPIALVGQPSPFTRSGPGLGSAIKPELCEFGGNCAYDGAIGAVQDNVNELSIVSFNRGYLTRLFNTDVGTSFAAPRVAHRAARLFETLPTASANLVRALLVASASVPDPSLDLLEPLGDGAVLKLCGYGRPNLEYAQTSDENRVVMYAESELDFDKFHIYEVPIPREFYATGGTRSISVTLAFDPPVRHSRFDYLGVRMSFRLIRGKTATEVAEAFRHRTSQEGAVDRLSSTGYDCTMLPKPKIREGSTLQRGTFTVRRRSQIDYGDAYYLVVRCEKKWAKDEHAPQRYAAAVVVKHSAQVNLYNTIRQRVRVRVRARRAN